MLSVVATPTTTVVAATTVLPSKTTVITVTALLLVAGRVLMAKTAKTAVLVVAAKVAWVAAEALLLRVLRALSALSRSVLRGRSGAARLSSDGRRARPAVLGLAKGLQRFLTKTLLSPLLLSVRTLMSIGLRTAERIRKTTESTCSSCCTRGLCCARG